MKKILMLPGRWIGGGIAFALLGAIPGALVGLVTGLFAFQPSTHLLLQT